MRTQTKQTSDSLLITHCPLYGSGVDFSMEIDGAFKASREDAGTIVVTNLDTGEAMIAGGRRQFYFLVIFIFALVISVITSCTSSVPTSQTDPPQSQASDKPVSYLLPTKDGKWSLLVQQNGRKPTGMGKVRIEDIGEFSFDAGQVKTLRIDIFQPGYFSVFDVLVHLSEKGDIKMDYHFDGNMDTHIIDAINGEPHWWYQAKYSAGWYESNVFRMDMYPYKDGTEIRLNRQHEEYLARICRTFGDEVLRRMLNGGELILPQVVIRSPRGSTMTFTDVKVTPHNVRSDILQPGTITALDILLSLGEQGKLSNIKLTWYESIGVADPVDSYWVEQIDEDIASGGCGFVYETGSKEFRGFAGSHIHIPLDVRVILSPEYALWFWICL